MRMQAPHRYLVSVADADGELADLHNLGVRVAGVCVHVAAHNVHAVGERVQVVIHRFGHHVARAKHVLDLAGDCAREGGAAQPT
jgi:hypothetical protein